jgi:hypothetical protein
MRPDDHKRVTEAGYFSPFGWRRDSARRLPLRQTAPSIGRDLSPQYAREDGCKSAVAQLSAVMRRIAWTR